MPPPSPEELAAILDLVAERRGIDFRDYRSPALDRGVLDRMARTSCGTGAEYRSRVAGDPGEVGRLVAALVVPVTEFFRDPAVFEALERSVLPDLARGARARGLLRAWVAGAATGEEAWSVAMLMAEACRDGPGFEVIASDIDPRSVVAAGTARYPREAVATVPAPLRARYLEVGEAEAIIAEPLRQRVHFSQHDVMGHQLAPVDAIVASFDLICFRNVLIYFDLRLQRKALERLVSELEPGGALVLGAVETMPRPLESAFEPYPGTAPTLRIFRRREDGR